MKKIFFKLIQTTQFILTCMTLNLSSQAQNTVIKAGHLFDSRTGKFLDNQTIIIKNGRISQIGSNMAFEKK